MTPNSSKTKMEFQYAETHTHAGGSGVHRRTKKAFCWDPADKRGRVRKCWRAGRPRSDFTHVGPLLKTGGLGDCFTELEHKTAFGLLLLFFLSGCQAFGQITLPVAVKLGFIAVHAQIFDDVVAAKLKIEIDQRHHTHFDKHDEEEEICY